MQRIRHIGSLVIFGLIIAACSSDSGATAASSASSAPPTSSATTTTTVPGTEIHATSTSGESKIGDPICDAEQHCLYPLTLPGTVTGDLTGTSISQSAGALVGTEYGAGGTLIFTGTIAGCGTGTLVLLEIGRGSTTGASSGTWEIAEGLGSGDLQHATGSGTTVGTPNADGSITGTITGHVVCG